jgi:hypothetical protein
MYHAAKRKIHWDEIPLEMKESILHGIEYHSKGADSHWIGLIIEE